VSISDPTGEVYTPQIFVIVSSSRMINGRDVLVPTPANAVDFDNSTFYQKYLVDC
jgi:hypothetical protein